MITRLRSVPAWVWWLVASIVGGALLYVLTGSAGASGTILAVGGAAAADGATRRAKRARAEVDANRPAKIPSPPVVDPPSDDRWDTGPAGRD